MKRMYYGKNWKIDGVVAGSIRPGAENGFYTVLFERDAAELADIEKINWDKPVIERLDARENAPALPEGYGFEVVDITYNSAVRTYEVKLKVASQYLGDVTDYQSQIAELESAADEQASQIEEQTGTIAAQAAQIQEQAAAIESLKESGSAALEAELDAAYEEGVNSVE